MMSPSWASISWGDNRSTRLVGRTSCQPFRDSHRDMATTEWKATGIANAKGKPTGNSRAERQQFVGWTRSHNPAKRTV